MQVVTIVQAGSGLWWVANGISQLKPKGFHTYPCRLPVVARTTVKAEGFRTYPCRLRLTLERSLLASAWLPDAR